METRTVVLAGKSTILSLVKGGVVMNLRICKLFSGKIIATKVTIIPVGIAKCGDERRPERLSVLGRSSDDSRPRPCFEAAKVNKQSWGNSRLLFVVATGVGKSNWLEAAFQKWS